MSLSQICVAASVKSSDPYILQLNISHFCVILGCLLCIWCVKAQIVLAIPFIVTLLNDLLCKK